MNDLKKALIAANITVKKFDLSKVRPVYTAKTSVSISKFGEELVTALGPRLIEHPAIVETINQPTKMEKLLEEYAKEEGLMADKETANTVFIPPEISHLTLNIDKSSRESNYKRFFCTTQEEFIDPHTSGLFFLELCGLSAQDAVPIARQVVPKYMPRRGPGIHPSVDNKTQAVTNYFNTFIPPDWQLWKQRNPTAWDKLKDSPPEEIVRFLQHLIPLKVEREYLYAWIYHSLMRRAYVYLVLQGNPGVGKNRLKLLLRALHGSVNSADGKKETFGANQSKFNSQMEDNTMIWYDELKYDAEMEPRMKEYQNDYIPIERKGIDATRSTEIFCSMVISNNYPRDNYLLFNSRKFVPLVLGDKALTAAMDPDEIALMSDKLDETRPTYDVKYVARIAKWLIRVGRKYHNRWPNLEYQGPKFWELAHASMSRWQKIAVLALTVQNARGPFAGWDEERKAFLWSKVEESLRRKKEYESRDYRDPTTVKAFFETYCDNKGNKVFEVEPIEKSVIKDFWIRPIAGLKTIKGSISLEQLAAQTAAAANGNGNGNGHHHTNGNSHTNGNGKSHEKKLVRPPGISDYKWRQMKEAATPKGAYHDL